MIHAGKAEIKDTGLYFKEKSHRIVVVGFNLLEDGGVKTLKKLEVWENRDMNINTVEFLRGK